MVGDKPDNTTNTDRRRTFLAHFAPLQSAILPLGKGRGMQIKLSIPESQVSNTLRLQLWRELPLFVTMELIDDNGSALDTAAFRARFSDSDDGVQISGNCDGMQIKLLIPGSDYPHAMGIQLWRGQKLRLTMEVSNDSTANNSGQAGTDKTGNDPDRTRKRLAPRRRIVLRNPSL